MTSCPEPALCQAGDQCAGRCKPSELYVARFIAQAWQDDYAIPVDPQGPTEWDVTDWMLALEDDDSRQDALEQNMLPWDYNDDLRGHPATPRWIKDWEGPFEIYVRRAS